MSDETKRPDDAAASSHASDAAALDPNAVAAALEAFAGVVAAEMRVNPGFAERVGAALSPTPLRASRTAKKPVAPPAELMDLDLAAALAEAGPIVVREQLALFSNAELAAYIRARRIAAEAPSRLNKTQLVNAIIRGAG